MGRRQQLQILLKTLMAPPSEGQPPLGKVYFQPETNVERTPPYMMYEQDSADNKHADNKPYAHTKRWQITVVDGDPDSVIPDRVAALRMSTFQRQYVKTGLYHTVFSLYF